MIATADTVDPDVVGKTSSAYCASIVDVDTVDPDVAGKTSSVDAKISNTDTVDPDVAEDNITTTMSSDLQGTDPPCSVPVRSKIGDRTLSYHLDLGVMGMEFPPLRSGSGPIKGGFRKNKGASKVVLPLRDPRAGLAMGYKGM